MSTRVLINQCQIITFLILKSDIIETSRIELRGIVLPEPSNQIKVTFPSIWYICDIFLFHTEIEGKDGSVIGGPKAMLPPSQIIGPPPTTPSSYAYEIVFFTFTCICIRMLDSFHFNSISDTLLMHI